jgi:two-component system sensor histidine kinase BaeS
MVGVVLATLVIVGLGTLVLANVSARRITEDEVRDEAVQIATNLDRLIAAVPAPASGTDDTRLSRQLRTLVAVGRVINVDELSMFLLRNGSVVGDEPDELVAALDLPLDRLESGDVVSGIDGNLVYAAAPAELGRATVVVVVTREANAAFGASIRLFLLAAAATLAIGALVAVALGRRLTRRVRDTVTATHRIADGDLSARLPPPAATGGDELDDLTRSVNSMAESLERSRTLEQQFLLSVSHDLRTPLTSIRGWAEAIADGAAEPARAASIISAEAQRLERLVADLLELSKLQAQAFSLQPRQVDLAALVRAVVDGSEPVATERQITVVLEAPGPVPAVVDPDRMAQVVANLLENGLRHARSRVVVAVGAGSATPTAGAVVTVDDDGPGIAPADLPHVFERLYVAQHRPERSESSSGLGLAIVHELVSAMGGTVTATAGPLGGARFVVQLRPAG